MLPPAPDTLTIMGADPIGLEAEAAAGDHGSDVHAFPQGDVGFRPPAWRPARMMTPWRTNPGLAARRRRVEAKA